MPEDLLNDDTALGMLRQEHARIDQLIASCLESDQPEFTRQAMMPLIQELEIHTAMEHEFFFPVVAKLTGNIGERAFSDDAELDSLKQRLEGLDPADPDYIPVLSELASRFQRHCYLEEQFGFLPIEMHDPDTHNLLIATAQRMRERRNSMLTRKRDQINREASAQARLQRAEAIDVPAGIAPSEPNTVHFVNKDGEVVGEQVEDRAGEPVINDLGVQRTTPDSARFMTETDVDEAQAQAAETDALQEDLIADDATAEAEAEAEAEVEAEDIGDLDNSDIES
jgi:hypothetical protein